MPNFEEILLEINVILIQIIFPENLRMFVCVCNKMTLVSITELSNKQNFFYFSLSPGDIK